MVFLLLLLFLMSLLIVCIGLTLSNINNRNKNTVDPNRVRRLHGQVDVLLETLGMKADGQLPDDVAKLVCDGNRLEAIKRYHERTGCSLKEAKDAVEGQQDLAQLERKLDRVLQELGASPATEEPLHAVKEAPIALAEIERLVSVGQLIPAVKQYREMTGSSLMEAKEAVEQIQRQQKNR